MWVMEPAEEGWSEEVLEALRGDPRLIFYDKQKAFDMTIGKLAAESGLTASNC